MKRPYNEVARIAAEAWNTMLQFEGVNVLGSWGVREKYVLEYQGMPSLALDVDATQFAGMVIISLNEGTDYYEVRLIEIKPQLPIEKMSVKNAITNIFFEDLGRTVDELIEHPQGMSDEEYAQIAMAHTIKKLSEN